ncbi:hypothetical protein GPL15_12785 [Clostridium sp. MCC353]|nr:hypothetical protein [Clostridium sp. MCC353]MBT9777380.1 hypothetical protein [Clostridium sp. MCC353]
MNDKITIHGTLDIEKVFQTIAVIIGERENVDIAVREIKKKEADDSD